MKASYFYSEKKNTRRYALSYRNTSQTDLSGNSSWKEGNYHYSYYYDWVLQHENVEAECVMAESSRLQLTNKNVRVILPQDRKVFPLKKLSAVGISFRRLTLPLITGGIIAPLSVLALFGGLLHLWMGLALILVGSTLFYYGWVGAWQITLDFPHHHLNYFIDYKSQDIEKLIFAINQKIREIQREKKL